MLTAERSGRRHLQAIPDSRADPEDPGAGHQVRHAGRGPDDGPLELGVGGRRSRRRGEPAAPNILTPLLVFGRVQPVLSSVHGIAAPNKRRTGKRRPWLRPEQYNGYSGRVG